MNIAESINITESINTCIPESMNIPENINIAELVKNSCKNFKHIKEKIIMFVCLNQVHNMCSK